MSKIPEPPEWGNDNITKFMDNARGNSFATFVQMKQLFSRLRNIEELFRTAIDNTDYSKNWFDLLFFLKAHSSFLTGVSLAMGTQIPEAFMVLRGILESSLYGFYIHKNQKLADIWLRRDESKQTKKIVRDKFQISGILKFLETSDQKIGRMAWILYERTIDLGAHPNEKSLTTMLKQKKKGNDIQFELSYLTDDPKLITLCLKTSAQIGVLSLKILELIIPERFKIIGLSEKLDVVSKGL
jgi:hypothetical protein